MRGSTCKKIRGLVSEEMAKLKMSLKPRMWRRLKKIYREQPHNKKSVADAYETLISQVSFDKKKALA